MFKSVRLIIAGIVAVIADILQWVLIPLGSEFGIVDPINDILDIFVAGIMVSLLGFHWVFVPSALGKLVPFVDMMPFWTGAVFIVGMGQQIQPNVQPGQNAMPLNALGNPMLAQPVSGTMNAQVLPPAAQPPQ